MTQQQAHQRLSRVGSDLRAARYALARAQAVWDSETGTPAQRFRGPVTHDDLRRCTSELDRTFILRLFGEFEGLLRAYRSDAMRRSTRPKMAVLMERVARSLSPAMSQDHLDAGPAPLDSPIPLDSSEPY
jgi:hypothetical protein